MPHPLPHSPDHQYILALSQLKPAKMSGKEKGISDNHSNNSQRGQKLGKTDTTE